MAKDPIATFDPQGKLDPDSIKLIAKGLENIDKGRFTYLEFKQTISKLVERGMSEDDAYESVFTTAETLGVERNALVASAQLYLTTLDEERSRFSDAMQTRLTQGLEADAQRIEKLAAQIEKLEQQQRDLAEKIAQGKTKQAELEENLAQVKDRITERGQLFEETYASLRGTMLADFEAMKLRANG